MRKYISALVFAFFAIALVFGIRAWGSLRKTEEDRKIEVKVIHMDLDREGYVGPGTWIRQNLSGAELQALRRCVSVEENKIYTFLQGPRSWAEKIPWSGEWCKFMVEGNPFGGFGCGLCCMANIYDTLSPYEVSPLGMYEHATESSGYAPGGEAGAIDWKDMRDSLRSCGISCRLHRKPATYRAFRKQIKKAKSAVVLVSSAFDATYWKGTSGHYVNLWMYREKDDTVFLAEPGSPEKNRSRIPLRYVYDALKTVSPYQYLTVSGYSEEENLWKGDGIGENWNRPLDKTA